MSHVHCPYSWRRLAFGPKVIEYPSQVGCYRDQAVLNPLETAHYISKYICCNTLHILHIFHTSHTLRTLHTLHIPLSLLQISLQINPQCCLLYCMLSRISIFYSQPGIRKVISQSYKTAILAHQGSSTRLAIMFLKYAETCFGCNNM